MPGLITYPPFPDDVPTHPLLVIDYALIKAGDEGEIDRLWKAATELGFWYLRNHGVDEEVSKMFEMGEETLALPFEEKMKYEQGDAGMSCGYKAIGANATDETGALDTAEFINVAKDDVLAWPGRVHRDYPSTVYARMESTLKPFVRKSLAVNYTLIGVLNARLGLPEGTLMSKHKLEEPSQSETRCIRTLPRPEGMTEDRAAIGAHCDVGSLSFLHNRLGGLQVLVPGTTQWQYVKPLPGYAICNIGDALDMFSGGILRSNLHRVVPAPKAQGKYDRWSLVFFTRPGESVQLHALTEKSPMIAEAVALSPNPSKYAPSGTMKDWFTRRTKLMRINNRKGPETWRASRGMEHQPSAR